jgi:hypothetical protein
MGVPAKIVLGVFMMAGASSALSAGGKDTLEVRQDFRPGDTLRYTTDGSVPDRTSRFVLYGANDVVITRTTIFKARLYRPGFLPSTVQLDTVYVLDGMAPVRAGLRAYGMDVRGPAGLLRYYVK